MSSEQARVEEMELFPDYEEEDDDNLEEHSVNPFADSHVRSFSFDDEDRPRAYRTRGLQCSPQVRGVLCCFICGIICISLLIIVLTSAFALIFHDQKNNGNEGHGNFSSDTAYYESSYHSFTETSIDIPSELPEPPSPSRSPTTSTSLSPSMRASGVSSSPTPSPSPSLSVPPNMTLHYVLRGDLPAEGFADRPQALRSLFTTLADAVKCSSGCAAEDLTETIHSQLVYDLSSCGFNYPYSLEVTVHNILEGVYDFAIQLSAEGESMEVISGLPMTPAQAPFTEELLVVHSPCGTTVEKKETMPRSYLPTLKTCSSVSVNFPGIVIGNMHTLSLYPVEMWWRGEVQMSMEGHAPVSVVVELQYGNAMSAISSVVQPPTRAALTITADEASVIELFQNALPSLSC